MNLFKKAWLLLGPRVIGGAASVVAGWVFVHTKGVIVVDPQQLTDVGVKMVELGGTMITAYGVAHKVASSKINPGDAANARLATAEKDAVQTGTTVQPAPPTR